MSTVTDSTVKKANSARSQAQKRLIANHQDEYNEILLEERKERGLFGLPGQRKPSLKKQLEEKDQEIERLRSVLEQYDIRDRQ